MSFWLVKSEPSVYSVSDLERDKVTQWTAVRNYQARNYLRTMKLGELVLLYHSVDEPLGVAGIAKVVREAYPDPTQFEAKGEYFDPKASKAAPRWFGPDLEFIKKFSATIPLAALRSEKALTNMVLLKRGSRLSVQPVSEKEFQTVARLGGVRKGCEPV